MSNPEKAPVPPSELSEQGDYPPPPPGPPPPQQQQHDQKQPPPQQQQADYAIPAYDPANPVFAPPPTAETASQSEKPPAQAQYAQPQYARAQAPPYAQAAPPYAQPTYAQPDAEKPAAAAPKKSSWLSQLGAKAAGPINNIAHKLGSQSFLPETLDKECEKAAGILRAFCKKGVYADPSSTEVPTSTDPKATESTGGIIDPTKEKPKGRVVVTIPPKVISKALGLAVFTTFRAGFHFSGATGSGVLIARLPDGSWGPPSGIQVHSVGAGLQIGLDIYDCVCVINSKEALAAFTSTRVSLGSDLAVVAGPYGAGGAVDLGATVGKAGQKPGDPAAPSANQPQDTSTLRPEQPDKKSNRRSLSASGLKPVFSYVKSRGFYAGIQVDGTVVTERKDANAAFYGAAVPADQILKGQVPAQGPAGMWPAGARGLLEVLVGAQAGVQPGVAGDGEVTDAAVPPPAASAAGPSGAAPPAYSDPHGTGAQFGGDVKYT